MQAGRLDLLRDLDPAARGEVVELGLQPFECGTGELRRGHSGKTLSPRNISGHGLSNCGDRRRRHRSRGDCRGVEGRARAAGVDIDTTDYELGGARYLRDGEILSDSTLDELRGFDAILLGAVGTPDVPPGVIERGLLLKMRFDLDLYVNQRPFIGTAPGHTDPARFRRHP